MTEDELLRAHGMDPSRLHRGGQALRTARDLLLAAGPPRCGVCGRLVDPALSGLHPMGPTLGHVIPVSQGGTDAIDNLRIEHRRCNLAQGNRPTMPPARIVTPVR